MKKNMMIRLLTGMVLTSAIALATPLTLTLQNNLLNGSGGATLTFVATATNTTAVTQNLSADSFGLQSPLILNDSSYFTLWPLILTTSQTFGPASLFTVFIPVSTPLGIYGGIFNILGGPRVNDQTVLGTASFQVNVVSVTATPEPASGLLFLVGGALLGLGRRYRR